MPIPPAVLDLIERFSRNIDAYKRGAYNETQVRVEYIDPLFAALGWDVHNRKGYAEAYKEVVHEDAVRVGSVTKAPDYSFRIGGVRKFFLEAKKPSVDIKNDVHPAYQVRRYAWSAKLPLSVLTDFEEFAVYDCRAKPDKGDSAAVGRVLYLRYTDYPARWDEIAAIFSQEAILTGSFDKYVESHKSKRGTAEVDAAFLQEIERWRELLARNIALRNPAIGQRELNFAVQQTIDRLIFLRICEDRGIEPYATLMGLQNRAQVYPRLMQIFRQADARYNSGLFHFDDEKGREGHPDRLTPGLAIDDRVLKEILKNLYYPDSPYEFSVLPADILGQVYEQFLGKVIRLTAGHQAKVEEKPEVRKAGGVYYTPTYIVEYIVHQTVGRLVEGKRPGPRGGVSRLRIVDPACGSGSFLIGAYQFLLDWHLAQYLADGPEQWANKANPQLYRTGRGEWRLTVDERKRILLNNLYGVDIDPQAVEVTKLSLLLKVLEGESEQTLNPQLALLPDRVLPDLAHNIRCGNSLIGSDFYEGQQLALLDEEETYRLNVFDWEAAFPEVFAEGGFDGVIGNPPYVRPHNLTSQDKEYFWKHYTTFVKKADLYTCFIERGVNLLKEGGHFGYIVSNGWLRLDSFENLRRFLLTETSLQTIIDFTGYVFPNANVKTAIVLLSKGRSHDQKVDVVTTIVTTDLANIAYSQISQMVFQNTYKHILDLSINEAEESIKRKMIRHSNRLEEVFELSFGLKTGDDSRFLFDSSKNTDYKPLLRGADIHRYSLHHRGEFVWYVPNIMKQHRRTARPGSSERFEQPKVLIRDTGDGLFGTFDNENFYVKDVIIVSSASRDARSLKYLIGILNSSLMSFYYETSFPTLHVQRDELASLPIRPIAFSDPADAARHDRMVALVQRMLDLHKQLAAATLPHSRDLLQRQIDATDRQIDRLVYALYGLNDEEIRIVEGRG